jgi:hypothetical protein
LALCPLAARTGRCAILPGCTAVERAVLQNWTTVSGKTSKKKTRGSGLLQPRKRERERESTGRRRLAASFSDEKKLAAEG